MATSNAPPSPTYVALSTPAYHEPAVRHNAQVISQLRSSVAAVLGIAAGILNLTGFAGFAFYLVASVLVGGLILALMAGGKADVYFTDWSGPWIGDVGGNALSFVLFWTLAYSVVHIYDL
ncbi:transmembrane protein 93-like protein [Gonapodya prolifera JEL478]|uniref:ER membrane protein complex subunit 6 n=1 Tax=Gonapodya prolifera (strain JEL478) TaxID=1344416 RepID=A0A139A7G5_GONPJ|nr:transmembrane protein 93-like protein [Gonapodya prolifera JEL478]|eukprot:KXS12720.1 transmembrane protein 93-like protein [Gonapodya prolifera JEL478]